MICPACGTETNSSGQPLRSYEAVTLHVAGKILGRDKTHRIWIKKNAPQLDLARWSRERPTFTNMRALAELIYPTIELALDESSETENKESTRMPIPLTLSASHVAEMARELNRILDAVDSEQGRHNESVTARIQRLNWSGDLPRHVAALMRAIREYRNLGEHERKEFSEADIQAIIGAWKVIHEWASSQAIEHETFEG